jgi:hypothetical protein
LLRVIPNKRLAFGWTIRENNVIFNIGKKNVRRFIK